MLAAVPSTLTHVGTAYGRHRLLAALQKNPVPDVQSTPPHRHTPFVFSVAPEPCAQGVCTWLQVLVAATHIMPVSEVQAPAPPQTQVAEEVCGAEPSGWSQARAVKVHKHEEYPLDPHDVEEPVAVLKNTSDLALFERQPLA